MFRTVMVTLVSAIVSTAIIGCDASTVNTGGKPGENILPRIDPKKEATIVEPATTDVEATVTVRNLTKSKISMHWLEESSGDRVHYHDVAAGKEVEQGSWEGHFWIILDKDGKPLGIYEVPGKDGVILIK